MKLSDSLYYGAVKNADLSSESVGSELTLLYDNNKDNVDNIAPVFGGRHAGRGGARRQTEAEFGCDGGSRGSGMPWKKRKTSTFRFPCAVHFDNNENQYRWVISLSRAVELTSGTSTAQGILLGGYQLLKPGTAL